MAWGPMAFMQHSTGGFRGMLVFSKEVRGHRATSGLLGLALFGVLISVGSGLTPVVRDASDLGVLPSLGGGFVGGVFVGGAAFASFVNWRRHSGTWAGWRLATGGLIACQSLTVTLVALAAPPPRSTAAFALLLATAVAGLVAVVLPLVGRRRMAHARDEGCGLALGLGLMASAYLLLQLPMATPTPRPVLVVMAVLVLTHVAAVALVLREARLPARMELLLVLSVGVVAAGLASTALTPAAGGWDAVVHAARAGVGAAWLAMAWSSVRATIEQDRQRARAASEEVPSTSREHRERMHELRSTIAGLVTGSAMLDNPDVPTETRQRLLESVRRELDRMDRLLSGKSGEATALDLDAALGPILELQRLKGRDIEVHGSGDVVLARYDALAEVLNILVDNASTHGGVDHSRVDVVRHDDTVDILVSDEGTGIPEDQRAHIFEWGRHGADSPGEGIGLHLAQRLVAEDGGSLRLAERRGPGSSFVITLPAVRPPLDDVDLAVERALEVSHARSF